MNTKQHGISLLEQLLVMGVITIILLLGIHHYFNYQRDVKIASIKSDLDRIFFALENYFYFAGCQANGEFSGNLHPQLSQDLKLTDIEEKYNSTNRSGILINGYNVYIHKLNPHNKTQKPSYQFLVSATPNKLSPLQIKHLLSQTKGYLDTHTMTLYWKMLPTKPYLKPSINWILGSHLKQLNSMTTAHKQTACAQ